MNLIPISQDRFQQLEERFSSTVFKSSEAFISFYNSGMINRTAEEVRGFAADVASTFKNVKLQGNSLLFISEEEVQLDEVEKSLRNWEVAVKAKRILRGLADEGVVTSLSDVCFSEEAPGILFVLDEELVPQKLTDEKLFRNAESIPVIHKAFSSLSDSPGHFIAEDFLALPTEFIGKIHTELFGQ